MNGVAALPGRAARFALRRARKAWRDAGLGAGLSRRAARKLIAESGVFDAAWYRGRYGDLGRWSADPILHYLDYGAAHGFDPSVLFWTDWYAARHPGSREEGGGPLAHYLRGKGGNPHPIFDDAHYRTQAADLAGLAPLAHYVRFGAGRFDPHPLFRTAAYRGYVPSGTTPLAHFLLHGAELQLDPGPDFDTAVYLARYPDVAASGLNPLVHYILGGAKDMRDPSPRFSTSRYLRLNANARDSHLNPLIHAIRHNWQAPAVAPPPPVRDDPRPSLTVSAIVPNYNHGRFLAERLDSILAQTAPPTEIIFLDDASGDDSLTIARRYAENARIPFRIVPNEQRSGSAFRQWSKGMELAKGDLVWFAESDDRCAPELLATLKAPFDDNVQLSYAQSRPVAGDGRALAPDYRDYTDDLSLDRWLAPYVANGRDEVVAALAHKNTIPNASAVLMRRATILPHAASAERFRQCGDWFLYLACAEAGHIAFNPAVLNDHRRHSGAVTRAMAAELELLGEAYDIRLDTIDRFALPDHIALASLAGLATERYERTAGLAEPLERDASAAFRLQDARLRDELMRRFASLDPVLHIVNGPTDLPGGPADGFYAVARPPAREPEWSRDIAPAQWIEGRAGVAAWSASALWTASDPAADPRRIATLAGLASYLRLKAIGSSGGDARRLAEAVARAARLPLRP